MTTPHLLSILLVIPIPFAVATILATVRYRITAAAVEVLVLARRVRCIDLENIEEVHRRGAFLRESWVGPKFWNVVIIRRRSGLLRNFAISPDEPDRFVESLNQAIARRRSAVPDQPGGRSPGRGDTEGPSGSA